MKRACKQSGIACLVAAALLLTACGGGGGGGGSTLSGPANVRALDPDRARTYFAGSTAPVLTTRQIHSETEQLVGRIQGNGDRSLLMSDISLFTTHDDLNLPVRLDTTNTVAASVAYSNAPGLSQPIRVAADAEYLSLGSAASLLPVMRYRGILLTGGAEAIRISGAAPDYPGWLDYSSFPVVAGEVFGYGGWLDYSWFRVEGRPITLGNAQEVSLYYGLSTGIASDSRPTSGSARWNGVMVATDISGAGRGNIFQGDAALSYHFGALTVDLSFSNVRDLTAGATRPARLWRNMPVTPAGAFSGTNTQGETAGRFYGGPGHEHEEAGGTFTYDDLVGAYGLKRQ